MEFSSIEWYAIVLDTIDALVAEEFPRTRPKGADNALRANLLWHAREHGADVNGLRAVLRQSEEWQANQRSPEPEPAPGPPPASVGDHSLVLPVSASPRGWADARGTRPLLFASWFPMLRILRDDPSRFERTLDMFHSWGVQGVRAFIDVRHPSYWRGREVLHEWPDYRILLATAAAHLRIRGMGWFVTAGDLQLINDESAPYRIAADALATYRDVLAAGDVNEGWQNSAAGRDAPEHFARLVAPFAAMGVPWATSACENNRSKDDMRQMMWWGDDPAPVATMHGPGGHEEMVRHIFNHRYEIIGFDAALMQGEPRGPGEDVSAGRVDAQGWIALAATVAAMTGQMYVLHCSRGVRDRDNDAPWSEFEPYFRRARAMMDRVPHSDVVAVGHGGRGGAHPEAIFASTREDGKFHGDDGVGAGSRQYHRCDVARYANGKRACALYGGVGDRDAKAVRTVSGTFYNTHGQAVASGAFTAGQTVTLAGDVIGDGVLFVTD